MPIWLRNLQKAISFNESLLKLHSEFLLNLLGGSHFDVSLACVDTQEIQHLNKVYRNKNQPTDVLSFQYHKIPVAGTLPSNFKAEWDRNLGDILLGMPVIEEVCRCEGVRLVDRLPVLVTHGLCHLIGHRHGNAEQWSKMYQAEQKLLISFNQSFGTNLKPLTENNN